VPGSLQSVLGTDARPGHPRDSETTGLAVGTRGRAGRPGGGAGTAARRPPPSGGTSV